MKLFKCCNDNKNITDEEVNQIELNAIGSNLNNNNQTNNLIQDKDEKNINEQLENKDKEIANLNKKIVELSNNLQNNKQKINELTQENKILKKDNFDLKEKLLEYKIYSAKISEYQALEQKYGNTLIKLQKYKIENELLKKILEDKKKAILNKSVNINSKTFSLLHADDDNLNKYDLSQY